MRRRWTAALAYVAMVAATVSLAPRASAQGYESDGTRTRGAPFSMVVNLATQHGYVYSGDVLIATTPISSGKRNYRTPTGTFRVLVKERLHHSNKYDNAPMPYMQRLSWTGLALHAGHVPGYPASHGCVRMPLRFARWLYDQPTRGMKVVIMNESRPVSIASTSGNVLPSVSRSTDVAMEAAKESDPSD